MKTREQAEAKALELYPETFGERMGRSDGVFNIAKRKSFMVCFDLMEESIQKARTQSITPAGIDTKKFYNLLTPKK